MPDLTGSRQDHGKWKSKTKEKEWPGVQRGQKLKPNTNIKPQKKKKKTSGAA